MSKKTTSIQDSAAALHSPEAERIERAEMRNSRVESTETSSSNVVGEAAQSNPSKNATVDSGGSKRLSGLRKKLSKEQDIELESEEQSGDSAPKKQPISRPEPLFQPISSKERDESSVPKGQLADVIRLETGKDKLLVNHKKLTDKISDILNRIEAEDSYLEVIAQKVSKKKHLGIVIDIPKRKDSIDHPQDNEGEEFAVGYLIDEEKPKKKSD